MMFDNYWYCPNIDFFSLSDNFWVSGRKMADELQVSAHKLEKKKRPRFDDSCQSNDNTCTAGPVSFMFF